jgi:hypothetical protein
MSSSSLTAFSTWFTDLIRPYRKYIPYIVTGKNKTGQGIQKNSFPVQNIILKTARIIVSVGNKYINLFSIG